MSRTYHAAIAVALLLAACAQQQGANRQGQMMQTPPAQRAAMSLPAGCDLQPNGTGQGCIVWSTRNAETIAWFDDLVRAFASAGFYEPDVAAQWRDRDGSRFWETVMAQAADRETRQGSHLGEQVTSSDVVAVPSRALPPGADACIRIDWVGLEPPSGNWRSREYVCIREFAETNSFQQVSIEIFEHRQPGGEPAPVDVEELADQVFASLRLP